MTHTRKLWLYALKWGVLTAWLLFLFPLALAGTVYYQEFLLGNDARLHRLWEISAAVGFCGGLVHAGYILIKKPEL